jgi:type II secretory pathway pseudopilin PulG
MNNKTGVMMRTREDVGETLIEIVFTIMIIGLTVGALISALAAANNASTVQRSTVQADLVMRNYAESTKAGAQKCTATITTYSVGYMGTQPAGYTLEGTSPAGNGCPTSSTTQVLHLKVLGPGISPRLMDIKVRTP